MVDEDNTHLATMVGIDELPGALSTVTPCLKARPLRGRTGFGAFGQFRTGRSVPRRVVGVEKHRHFKLARRSIPAL